MHVGGEHRSVDTQLTGERGHDLWVGLLADAQHPTGKPGITELDGEAEVVRLERHRQTTTVAVGITAFLTEHHLSPGSQRVYAVALRILQDLLGADSALTVLD